MPVASEQRRRPGRNSRAAEVATFVAPPEAGTVPEDVRRLAERCFVDTVGVTLAGAVDETGRAASRAMTGSDGPARVLRRDDRLGPPAAAFVNGTAGHALDYDDV